jgi:hypothetical protein
MADNVYVNVDTSPIASQLVGPLNSIANSLSAINTTLNQINSKLNDVADLSRALRSQMDIE